MEFTFDTIPYRVILNQKTYAGFSPNKFFPLAGYSMKLFASLFKVDLPRDLKGFKLVY